MKQPPPSRRAARLGLGVELRTIRWDGIRFPGHWHDDVQFIATLTGTGRALVEGVPFALPPGSLLAVPTRAVHTAFAADGADWTFHSLHLAPSLLADAAAFAPVVLAGSGTAVRRFQAVLDHVIADVDGLPGAVGRFAQSLRDLPPPVPMPVPAPLLLAAREVLLGDTAGCLDLRALARAVDRDPAYLSRAFRRAFHLPPMTWRDCARIEGVKARLRRGVGVREAAAAAGYVSASHFSRRYRAVTGLSARSYAAPFRMPGNRKPIDAGQGATEASGAAPTAPAPSAR